LGAALRKRILITLLLSSCGTTMPRISFHGQDGALRATYVAEQATDQVSWERGLMGRTSLATDRAMIFIFPDDTVRYFWMKDTLIALDIIFVRADGSIESIAANEKPCVSDPCPTVRSSGPVRYVVEIAGGEAERRGIRAGDALVQ
jgi:uncharacterized membrane protein (UPF0127 family)